MNFKNNNLSLKFKLPIFYSEQEFKLFERSLDIIKIVERFNISNNSLEIIIKNKIVHFIHFQDLVGLALRYDFNDRDQFNVFINQMTMKSFDPIMWEVSKTNSPFEDVIELMLRPVKLISIEDEEYLLSWLDFINSITHAKIISNYLVLVIKINIFSIQDYENIVAIFKRYDFENISQIYDIKILAK